MVFLALVALFGAFPVAPGVRAEPLPQSEAASDDAVTSADLAPQVSVPLTFELRSNVSIERDRIYLSDVAQCVGVAFRCDESAGIDLGAAPEPGRTLRLDATRVRDLIAQELPGAAIEVTGPLGVTVRGESLVIEASQIEDGVRRALMSMTAESDDFQVELESVQVPVPVQVRPGLFELSFPLLEHGEVGQFEWASKHLNGHVRLAVVYQPSDGIGRERSFWVIARFRVTKLYPVARRLLTAGTVLSVDDFVMRWLTVSPVTLRTVSSLDDIVGKVLKRDLSAGSAPSANQLGKPLLVERGSVVEVSVRAGALTLSAKGEALTSGSLGERIQLIYGATKKRLSGRVLGPSLVEVKL